MNGTVFLALGLAASLGAAFAYATSFEWVKKYRFPSAMLAAVSAFLASASLMALIFQNDVSYSYVVSYSSKDLPVLYKISAFWAGQQGSFLLWLLIHSIASVIIHKQKKFDNPSMAVFMIIEAVLGVLVLAKSPFAPQELAVEDGFGLNPLLQDPWMAVHPPIIFMGYALLAAPFSLSVGALIGKKFGADWIDEARKWTLISWSFLGAGIFIGGYWAYKVLGWGGYWGWDPVENSSLVPWLVACVLLHLLKVAKVKDTALPLTHLAAIFTFSLVIYGTFLTRSGLLGDFSVHSFGKDNIGATLAIVNAAVLLGGLFLLTIRSARFPKGEIYSSYNNRIFLMLFGALLISFIAAIIFLGMSMPLITGLMGHPAAVDTNYYVRATLPFAIAFVIVMILSVLRLYNGKKLPFTAHPLIIGLLSVSMAVAAGVFEALPIILAGLAMTMGAASIYAFKKQALSLGGAIAHVGVALGLFAIVLSGSGSKSETVEFAAGDTKEILGKTIAYEGQEFLEDNSAKFYKYKVDGKETKALTKLRRNGTDAAREPAIYKDFTGDIYIAPSPSDDAKVGEMTLKRWDIALDGDFAYIFEEVEITETDENHLTAVARISVTDGQNEDVATPSITVSKTSGVSDAVDILGGKKRIRLTGVSENQKKIRIEVLPSLEEMSKAPVVSTISAKPYIWLLWLGAAMIVIGTMTAAFRKK
ncbi:MAG: cytochrome c biogenesis protein CcsA [Selenomonadaceae bacterium]|nr:cytochrome c biogenesis protein CcsA [Selenomonadaceae bacterium]